LIISNPKPEGNQMEAFDRILILDLGSQVTQLIARRVREIGAYCEIWPHGISPEKIRSFGPKGIILSGGPASVNDAACPRIDQGIFELGLPILGICLGQMVMCAQLGGRVETQNHREFGPARVTISGSCDLLNGKWASDEKTVWMSHGDIVSELPPGFRSVAYSPTAPMAIMADDARRFYGLMFHPEVSHTEDGADLLASFVKGVCGVSGGWCMGNYRETALEAIRCQVGSKRVICALSGGVDSSVAAVLIHEAIGDQLVCVFVDHGLLREGEAEQVVSTFRDRFSMDLIHVDARELFLSRLDGITDPEEKRKIIGSLFIEVFEKEASRLDGIEFLAQGTLYPDVIESVSATGGPSVTIKSHHNVGGLPRNMGFKLIEPLRELFKDEVRELGRTMGLPESIVGRHPFPGPGLAIRILGSISEDRLEILRKADAIFIEEIRRAGLYDDIWQAFVVLLPIRTVGVMGDHRTYEFACALRAVTSVDGMTADVYPFEVGFLSSVGTRIVNEVRGINRVTYDLTPKPPGTIEWE
jgi:GMP synthase (glutamine-hydrolysing)